LIAEERLFLKQNEVGLVVADIPTIALAAARRAGIPNIAIGNFSRDWIYDAYAQTDFHREFFVEKFRTVYEQTDLLLRLPFAPPMEVFPRRKDTPLLASPGTLCREKTVHISLSDICTQKPCVLLSFASRELNFKALENIRALSARYEFFCVQPMAFLGSCIHSVDRHGVSFADTLAFCDIVISKPGFGLVSECIVNGKLLIYCDRGDFAEYPYLVEGVEAYLQHVHLPSDQLYAGYFSQQMGKNREPVFGLKY